MKKMKRMNSTIKKVAKDIRNGIQNAMGGILNRKNYEICQMTGKASVDHRNRSINKLVREPWMHWICEEKEI